MGKLSKSDREWQRELSPEEFRITRQKGRSQHLPVNTGIRNKMVLMYAVVVVNLYLPQKPNMTVAVAGQASIRRSTALQLKSI